VCSSDLNSFTEWLYNQNNQMTINIVQQAVGLLFSVLIFVKSYDFHSLLSSVRKRREEAKRLKEKKQLEKFRKLLELSKSGEALDISKVALSSENEDDDGENKNDRVMRTTRKKSKRENSIV